MENIPPGSHDEEIRMPHSIPRGLLRFIVVSLLANNEMTGTEIMHTLGDRSSGKWKPSPGSIYPILGALEEDGLIETVSTTGRSKTYSLSEEGQVHLKAMHSQKSLLEHKVRLGRMLWAQLLGPVDQVHFHLDGIDAGVDLLIERIESLSPLEQKRVRERVEELLEKFSTLLNLVTHGEPVND